MARVNYTTDLTKRTKQQQRQTLERLHRIHSTVIPLMKKLMKANKIRFNLSTFISHDTAISYHTATKHRCGTSYCVIGYAANTTWFKRRGLTLNPMEMPRVRGSFNGREYCLADFFGISSIDIMLLFYPADYGYNVKLGDVQRRLGAYIKRLEKQSTVAAMHKGMEKSNGKS